MPLVGKQTLTEPFIREFKNRSKLELDLLDTPNINGAVYKRI